MYRTTNIEVTTVICPTANDCSHDEAPRARLFGHFDLKDWAIDWSPSNVPFVTSTSSEKQKTEIVPKKESSVNPRATENVGEATISTSDIIFLRRNTAIFNMRGKRSKQYRKLMQSYGMTFGFREPYQVLGELLIHNRKTLPNGVVAQLMRK